MIINFREDPISLDTIRILGGRITLDGKDIPLVWFADTEAGIIKTYNVMGDGKPHTAAELHCAWWTPEDFPGREVECPKDGALSETLRGVVRLYPPSMGLY